MARRLRRDGPWLALPWSALFLLCLLVITQPVEPLAFDVESHPPEVALRNFYGNERNATGGYRWAKPEAFISMPTSAPGDYRITLLLGDLPVLGTPRTVHIYANGVEVAAVAMTAIAQEVAFTYRYTPTSWAWSDTANHHLDIELITAPYTPPQDSRALGVIFYRATVAPDPIPLTLFGHLLLGWAILGLAYLALRLVRWQPWQAAMLILLPVVALLLYALTDRHAALTLALRLVLSPWPGLAFMLGPALAFLLVQTARRAPIAAPGAEERFWSRHSLPLVVPLALAIGVRADRLGRQSLWSDEGFTIQAAQQPWSRVLGFAGAYDSHPPLHFALVKAMMIVFPTATAGRILSAATGALTIAVIYALAARLSGRAAALAASLALAIAPLHIWYSQEARMYAPATLVVGLSYLAVVGCVQAERRAHRWGWAAIYAFALAVGMYLVYSAVYALLPQLALIAVLVWRDRTRVLPLVAGGTLAVLAFLPWLPQLARTTGNLGPERSAYLSPTPADVQNTLLAIVGLRGISTGASYYSGLWEQAVIWGLLALVLPALILGTIAWVRSGEIAALAVAGLSIGTIASAILFSIVSPGFAPRTVLFAAIGWALLVGGVCIPREPRWFVIAGRLVVVAALVVPCATWWRMREGGYKEPSRALAFAAAETAGFGQPIVVMDYILPAYIAAYSPDLQYFPQSYLWSLPPGDAAPAAIWLVYAEWEGVGEMLRQRLLETGYERIQHRLTGGGFLVDLFAQPGRSLGVPALSGSSVTTAGWQLAPGGMWHTAATGPELVLRADKAGAQAQLNLPAAPAHLYTLVVEARTAAGQEEALVAISCLSATGAEVARANSRAVRVSPSLPTQGAQSSVTDWRALRVAVLCPRETAQARVVLEQPGMGEGQFRDLVLWQLGQGSAGIGRVLYSR